MNIAQKYYKSELNKLGQIKKNDSIKIKLKGKQTNYIAVNKDSIKALREFLNNIQL